MKAKDVVVTIGCDQEFKSAEAIVINLFRHADRCSDKLLTDR